MAKMIYRTCTQCGHTRTMPANMAKIKGPSASRMRSASWGSMGGWGSSHSQRRLMNVQNQASMAMQIGTCPDCGSMSYIDNTTPPLSAQPTPAQQASTEELGRQRLEAAGFTPAPNGTMQAPPSLPGRAWAFFRSLPTAVQVIAWVVVAILFLGIANSSGQH